MLKLITLAAPLLLQGRSKPPARSLAGRLLMAILILGAGLCLLGALFVWVLKTYSLELAFLTLGGTLFLGALIAAYAFRPAREAVKEAATPAPIGNDALAKYIPESVAQDPLVQRIVKEISDKPVAATASAVVIGMLLSREVFGRD